MMNQNASVGVAGTRQQQRLQQQSRYRLNRQAARLNQGCHVLLGRVFILRNIKDAQERHPDLFELRPRDPAQ